MINYKTCLRTLAGVSCAALAAAAGATPVVYTLRTVADGKLGNHVFAEALVTIQMRGDTATVQKQAGSNGGVLYTNATGTATVTVTDGGGRTTTATFAPGEVYVRYDAGSGIAGFGSPISPSYPIALGCDDYSFPAGSYTQDCTQGDWGPLGPSNSTYGNGTANALAALAYYVPWSSTSPNPYYYYSAETVALPNNLTQSTLLTGIAHFCATTYSIGTDVGTGDLSTCPSAAPRGLKTDHGGFFLQDQVGGTLAPPNPFGWGSWNNANTGALHVEVDGED